MLPWVDVARAPRAPSAEGLSIPVTPVEFCAMLRSSCCFKSHVRQLLVLGYEPEWHSCHSAKVRSTTPYVSEGLPTLAEGPRYPSRARGGGTRYSVLRYSGPPPGALHASMELWLCCEPATWGCNVAWKASAKMKGPRGSPCSLSLSLSLSLSFDRQNGFVYYTTRILLAITSQCRAMPGPLTTRHKCTVYGDDDLSLSVCLSVSLSVLS